jgi:hypothetical protein
MNWNWKNHLENPLAYVGIFALAFAACAYLLVNFTIDMRKLEEIEESLVQLQHREKESQFSQTKEAAFLAQMNAADHFYIDKHLETLQFLDPQIRPLLKESANRLLFSEEKTRKSEHILEVEEKQQQPVLMNGEDLKKLLSLIEDVSIPPFSPQAGKPQLLIKQFQLTKKTLAEDEEVFSVTMQLIKREGVKNP